MNPDQAAHAVLFSQDRWAEIWPSLDAPSRAALRGVCSAMRGQVDGSIRVVASPSAGLSDAELTTILARWPGIVDLTLLRVPRSAASAILQPLAMATLTRLTSLTVREDPGPYGLDVDLAPRWPMPTLSRALSATLRVIDFSCCAGLNSNDAVRSCVQLRCLWIPSGNVTDILPLAACSETLKELWMAGNSEIGSLALLSLMECTRLAKLDICDCGFEPGVVEYLKLTCPQLADPSLVELEGLVHELQPGIPPHKQHDAMDRLQSNFNLKDADLRDAIAAAGGIPPLLVQLVRTLARCDDAVDRLQQGMATKLLRNLAEDRPENQAAIAAAGVMPPLVRLLRLAPDASVEEMWLQEAAADALGVLAAGHYENQAAIASAGAIPLLVQLMRSTSSADVQRVAAEALGHLASGNAPNQAAITTAGAIPLLVQLEGPGNSPDVQMAAATALHHLAAYPTLTW